jgi:hypothetical protein
MITFVIDYTHSLSAAENGQVRGTKARAIRRASSGAVLAQATVGLRRPVIPSGVTGRLPFSGSTGPFHR